MPVKKEPVGESTTTTTAASVVARTADPVAPPPPQRSPADAANAADDDGAIEISDVDAGDALRLDILAGADALAEATAVLTGGAESPPALSRDYATAFFASDPRIAFDALHIGALRCIEACEGLSWSEFDYPPWYVPDAGYVEASASPSGRSFFHVPAMHSTVQARAPIEREDARVEALLSHPTRAALTAAIGADMLEQLRLHSSSSVVRHRQRRSSPGRVKKHSDMRSSGHRDA